MLSTKFKQHHVGALHVLLLATALALALSPETGTTAEADSLAEPSVTEPSAAATADSIPNYAEETLTGDWGGVRKALYQRGVDIGITHKSDILSNVSGGLDNGTAWEGHTELRLGFDLDKLLGWNGTTAYIHYHSDLGAKFNTHYVGAIVGVDNIEVGRNTAQFFHAWIQKNMFDDKLSLLAGLYPIDSEFYVTDTSGLFLQPPYGMSNEVALTGKAGPPIFPLGALAIRARYTTDNDFYLMGAITDGVPGDPKDPYGTHIKLGDGDGTLSILELGYIPQPAEQPANSGDEAAETFNKTAIGLWRYSGKFDPLDGIGNKHHSQGAYILAERTLMLEQGHPSQGLSGFVRYGVASEAVNPLDWTASLGLRYRGLIPGRDDDIAGIAVTVNHASDRLHADDSQETDWEVTYRAQVTPWLAIQPNLQYFVNPGMDKSIDNAWIVGARVEVEM